MKRAWFITGTDTEIGKTFTTCALIHAARQAGQSAIGMKPIAAGFDANGQNEDVRELLAACALPLTAADINPYALASPIAPHIAAQEEGVNIDFERIADQLVQLQQQADCVFVEGVGGFCVPLGDQQDSADLAIHLGLPVILVVGMRLGCINHALLTAEAIRHRGLRLAGWVANRIDPNMARFEQNLATLTATLTGPCLGVLPYCQPADPALAARKLSLPD